MLPLAAVVQLLPGTISAGSFYSGALAADGTLRTWGSNGKGQLGDNTTTTRPSPVQPGTASTWAQPSDGGTHILGLRANGTLWAWSDNTYGQLGDGSTTQRNNPTQVGTATNRRQVAAGYQHTRAIAADGTLWAWGNNGFDQLGTGINCTSPMDQPGAGRQGRCEAGSSPGTYQKN